MFQVLFTIYLTLKNIAYYSILFSYKTGQLIVFGLKSSVDFLSVVFSTLWAATVVVAEDFVVFITDLSTRLRTITDTVTYSIEKIFYGASSCVSLVYDGVIGASSVVLSIHGTIIDILSRIFTCAANLVTAIKQFFVLFGCGVYFAVTFIPLSIVYVCITATYCIGRFFEEILNVISVTYSNFNTWLDNVYEFVTDVPIESTIGLVIAVCLGYVLTKFHIMVYKSVCKVISSVFNKVQTNRSIIEINDEDSLSNKNGTCVICFERNKCLLTMPCRHLCMCVECWEELQNYQGNNLRSCPICRRDVQYTIHVY